MLAGPSSTKPSLETIRRIKKTLHDVLDLPNDAMITVTQLACLEEDCAPLETVIGLLQPGRPQRQYKIHKATNAVTTDDLQNLCESWGQAVQKNVIDTRFKEN